MRIDIMKEIKLVITTAISSQISEIAKAIATEIKTAISMEMSPHTNETMTISPIDLVEDLDPITQTPTMTNDDFTSMDVDTDQRKRKITNENEDSATPNRITPAITLRTQRSRGIASTSKKTLKEGQKTDLKKYEQTDYD